MPIKIKTGTDMYAQWKQQHKHEGRGIPIVYIVRADGETLYAKSGKPKNEALGQMLTAALGDAGYIMTERDITRLEKVTTEFKKHREQDNIDAAIRSLRKAKPYLDRNGNVASYAKSAIALQTELDLLMQSASESIDEVEKSMAGEPDSEQELVAIVETFDKLKSKYKSIKSLKKRLSTLQSMVNDNKSMKSIQNSLKIIAAANGAKTQSSKSRTIEKLKTLVEESDSAIMKERAAKALQHLQSE